MPDSTLPIVVANTPEGGASIGDINTLPELLNTLAKYLATDAGGVHALIDGIPFTISKEPDTSAGCCDRVEFITGAPCHISFNGCDFYQYPVNTPLLIIGDLPTILTEMTTEEISTYKLSDQSQTDGTWAILRV